jgi:hypothetical protein
MIVNMEQRFYKCGSTLVLLITGDSGSGRGGLKLSRMLQHCMLNESRNIVCVADWEVGLLKYSKCTCMLSILRLIAGNVL